MYNPEIKTSFLNQYTQSSNTAEMCTRLFDALSKFEEEWGADLCTMPAEKLQPAVESVVGLRFKSKWTKIIVLKDYGRWCLANGVPGASDGIMNINATGLDKIRVMMVSSPAHLQACLDAVFDPESDKTIDCTYRCYYWLAYAGFPEKEILNVKVKNVDLDDLVVRYNGKEYPIYREGIKAIRNSAKLKEFSYIHPLYSKRIVRNRVDGDMIMRGIKAEPNICGLRAELSRRNTQAVKDGKTFVSITYYRVWLSGVFYRALEKEKMGLPVDFSDTAKEFMSGKEYKLDSGRNTLKSVQRRIEKDYVQDYERWKAAYMI